MRSKEVEKAIKKIENVRIGLMNFNELIDDYKEIINSVEVVLNYIKELEEKNDRNKKITISKLTKLLNGVENDFPIMLGEQQPLWQENTNKYLDKQVIRDKIKWLENRAKEYGYYKTEIEYARNTLQEIIGE